MVRWVAKGNHLDERSAVLHHLSDSLESPQRGFEVHIDRLLATIGEVVVCGPPPVLAVGEPIRGRTLTAAVHLPPVVENMYAWIGRAAHHTRCLLGEKRFVY